MIGKIFDIQRFCINDGPGIRTTVFLKGCPLDCVWCHNPESKSKETQIMFYREKCVGCGKCVNNADENFVCANGAREICGKNVTVEFVTEEVLKDEIFYKTSGGGVTLSGGEPLLQSEFAEKVLEQIKTHNIHTAVETCGFAKSEDIKKVAKYTDLFLFDYKETSSAFHKEFTGVGNEIILENLKVLSELKKDVILRCPIVKGCNDRTEHFEGIAETADKYENILHIEIEPYHCLGENKSIALGESVKAFEVASGEEKNEYIKAVQKSTRKQVIFA